MRAKLVAALGILLSAALLIYIASVFDLGESLRAIRMAHPGWILAGTLVYVSLFAIRGVRWAILLKPLKPISIRAATEVFLVGFMANNILPARLGDVARAVVLSKRQDVPASATFSNVMLERVFDGLTVVGMLAIALWLAPPEAAWVHTVGFLMGAVFLGALAVSALLVFYETQALRWARALLRVLPAGDRLEKPILGIATKLASGLHPLKSLRLSAQILALSCLIWGAEVLVYVLVQQAFGLTLSFWALALVMSVLTLGLTAPSAPGFVGVFEGLAIAGLGLYGVEGAQAPAFAIALHLVHYIPGTLLGLAIAFGYGLKLKELQTRQHGVPIEA